MKAITSNVLSELNHSLATKSDIDDSLAALVDKIERKFEKKLAEEINKRDEVISDLNNRIDDLEARFSSPNVAPEKCVNDGANGSDDHEDTGAANYETAAELEEKCMTCENLCIGPTAETKEVVDTLLISDSLMRHVRFEKLCPTLNNMKVFLSGARCDRLLSEIARLSSRYTFRKVIVHVGSNYIPHAYSDVISNELTSFLDALCQLLPDTKIAFSELLPKKDQRLLCGINNINGLISDFCQINGMDCIRYPFYVGRGMINRTLLCWDGTHVSYEGVFIIEQTLKEHLIYENKY